MRAVKRKRTLLEIFLFIFCVVVVLCIVLAIIRIFFNWNRNQTHLKEMIVLAEETIPELECDLYCQLRVIEKDKYGRYLFIVDHVDPLKRGYIIVQKTVDETGILYYYSKDSTLLVGNISNWANEKKQQLNKFKELNDWNQPLQDNKMVPISIE